MDTRKILSVIDEITEAGCLNFLITGGEPLLRNDFPQIYSHAKKNGLLVTVFTNGTLITDSILDLFRDLPPYTIEISLYGATAVTYEKITGITGSYEKCINGIRKLIEHKINVRLKTILMAVNSHEFFDIENMAKRYGIKFRFDAAIFPRINGDKSPLTLRVPPRDAVEKEFSNLERAGAWKEYFDKVQGQAMANTLYTCGAGLTVFHIDPYGNLKPCLMINNLSYNLSEGSFLEGWHDIISLIRNRKVSGDVFHCNQCDKLFLCGFCPAFFEWENGQEDIRSDYTCDMGNYRFQMIGNHNKQGA